jgi:aminoglycoside phosphotransferase (APT) family kinase protein
MNGVALRDAELSDEELLSVAAQLGDQMQRTHALRPSDRLPQSRRPGEDTALAAERSSLPAHLVAQVNDYVARLGPFDSVFVHGDLIAAHAFVDDGQLVGIIDWGDAVVTDRHYELIQVYRDMFACDKAQFRVFLEAAGWPVDEDFANRALGLALHRQAVGLTQHHTIDVFMPIAARFPLKDVDTLEELATLLFSV